MEKYLQDSARTAPANKLHTELVPIEFIFDQLAALRIVASPIDQAKKALFYGKDTTDLQFTRTVLGEHEQEVYNNVNVNLLHSILGILTEAHELAELLALHLVDPEKYSLEALRPKLLNESGDGLWYQALLFRELDTTFESVGDLNTAKLLERFPVKFTEDLAIHRDESTEDAVFLQS